MIETLLTDWLLPYLFVIAAGWAIIRFCGWRAERESDRKARGIADPAYWISKGRRQRP